MKRFLKHAGIFLLLIFMIEVNYSYSFDVVCGTTQQPSGAPFIQTTGTVKALIFFVRFNNTVYEPGGCFVDPDKGWPDTLYALPEWADDFIDDTATTPYTSGGLSDFFYQMSDSVYNFIGDVFYYETPENLSYYEDSSRRRGWLNKEIIEEFDSVIDYSDYDADSDGDVDMIIFIYRFWSPTFAGFSGSGIANLGFAGSITHDDVDIIGGFPGSGISQHSTPNLGSAKHLVAHELGHYFYGGNHFDYTGTWGIFDGYDGSVAMSGYERLLLDWITPTLIDSDQSNLEITDAITTADYYRININATDYFLLENRQQLSINEQKPFCSTGIPGKGLLISHIRPNESKIDQLRWEAADGTFTLKDAGDSTDTYKPGNKIQFTPWTKPNSDDVDGTNTGVAVTNIQLSGNTITVDIDLSFTSGTITENSWWEGSQSITGDITVSTGNTLTVEEASTIKFEPNAGLIVDGTLNVEGTESDPVTFERSGTSGDWEGIEFRTGSAGTVSYAIIDYAFNSTGISIYNVSPTIENTTIKNCLWGLYLYYSSSIIRDCILTDNEDAIIDYYSAAQYLDNTIRDSQAGLGEGYGLFFVDSDPVLFRNLIHDNVSYGIYALASSYVELGSSSETGNNVIANNSSGIVSHGSNTYVYVGAYPSWGGDNSIYDNTPYDAAAYSSSYIVADFTWWDSASGGDIYYDATSAVYDDFKLSSDPNDPAPLIASMPSSPSSIAGLSKTGNMQQSATAGLGDVSKDAIFDLIQRRNLYRKVNLKGSSLIWS